MKIKQLLVILFVLINIIFTQKTSQEIEQENLKEMNESKPEDLGEKEKID